MPKSKELVESDSGSDSDSSFEEPKAKKKKQKQEEEKPSKSQASEPKKKQKRDPDGNVMFQLSKMRFVTVNEFRGKKMVNIREFYEADGELKPGRKGIALNMDQWKALKSIVDDIDSALDEL